MKQDPASGSYIHQVFISSGFSESMQFHRLYAEEDGISPQSTYVKIFPEPLHHTLDERSLFLPVEKKWPGTILYVM
jgi:hypothetical protein